MSNQLLSASGFIYSSTFYKQEFENVMSQIIICYNLMKSDGCSLQNKENLIRDKIVNEYLMNNDIRRKESIEDYLFYRELPTINNSGRIDIYVATKNIFCDVNAYYIIECKRLDAKNQQGKTGLNAEYIKNGISRFITQQYPTYRDTVGMIGFVVEKMNIHQNVTAINALLNKHFSQINTEEVLTQKTIVPNFKFSYCSRHKVANVSKIIYHLMLDFSDNISS